MTAMRKAGFVLALACLAALAVAWPASAEEERRSGHYTIVDADTGQIIWRTGLIVHPGDEYLTSNNLRYRAIKLDGDTVFADFLGREELRAELPPAKGWAARLIDGLGGLLGLARRGGEAGPVVIYHTHNDESYVPTDGTHSRRGRGGIVDVGEVLAQRLREQGIYAIHTDAAHDPHDGLAYERSRRTAAEYLDRNPTAFLDVHRDAAPRQEYADQADGVGVTKVQIVLGRSNPNLQANEAFAKQVKAALDRSNPGFVKGIFYGRGAFNQDLGPRSLLLEFGAHTNARESAERAAGIFAKAAGGVIGAGAARGAGGVENRGAWRSILIVVGGIAAVALLFLLLNSGSFRGAARSLRGMFGREFTSALGEEERQREREGQKEREDRDEG